MNYAETEKKFRADVIFRHDRTHVYHCLTLWHPLLTYGHSYITSCAKTG